jgi:hypothetical protein
MQVASEDAKISDAVRMEHVWLLLAAECTKELAVCLPQSAAERMRNQLVRMTTVQLKALKRWYHSQITEAAKRGAAEALETLQQEGQELMVDCTTGARLRISLWNDVGPLEDLVGFVLGLKHFE